MEGKDLTTLVYEKMQAEQEQFKSWLVKQSPDEILNNAYQYAVKEDILFSFDVLELEDGQAAALLSSPSPLEDVYKEFTKRETGYMDIIRDCVEDRAKQFIQAREEVKSDGGCRRCADGVHPGAGGGKKPPRLQVPC